MNNYQRVVVETLRNNGGTFLLPDMLPLAPTARMYCLSLDDDKGIVIPYRDFDMNRFTMWCLNGNEAYINMWNKRDTLRGSLKAVGTWVDSGDVYLDVATVIPKDQVTLDIVLELARVNRQRAIWDHELKVAIETGVMV